MCVKINVTGPFVDPNSTSSKLWCSSDYVVAFHSHDLMWPNKPPPLLGELVPSYVSDLLLGSSSPCIYLTKK